MSQFNGLNFIGPIQVGQTAAVWRNITLPVGVHEKVVILGGDSCLISLFITSVTGTLQTDVHTAVEVGKEFPIISFPELNSATTNLLLRKASITMGVAIIRVTILGGPATFDLDIRALATADGTTRILGASNADNYALTVTSTAAILIPAANQDRAGLAIKNNSAAGTLYVGFTSAKASATQGMPVSPGGVYQVDLSSGQALYASSSGPDLDVRIAEAFS